MGAARGVLNKSIEAQDNFRQVASVFIFFWSFLCLPAVLVVKRKAPEAKRNTWSNSESSWGAFGS